MDWWALPGPAAFFEGVSEALRVGDNVVVGAPTTAVNSIASILKEHLPDGLQPTLSLTPSGQLPIDDIFAELEIAYDKPPSRTAASLIAALHGHRIVLVRSVEMPSWPAWARFLDDYSNACRSVGVFDRTQFLVLASGVSRNRLPSRAPALRSLIWDGHIGEADVFSYVTQSLRLASGRLDAKGKLLARIVMRLALWDFELADRLLKLEWHELFDPVRAILAVDAGEETGRPSEACWEAGGIADFDGTRFEHALVLLKSGKAEAELSLRLWAAQAAELLPALELKRRQLAQRMKSTRLLPANLGDLDDLEFGELLTLARQHRLPAEIVRLADKYRRLRNRLAHLEPLTPDQALELL
ncbi:hypothetical protein [Pelomonas cellulosilytica]|uniref:Uncharacterized protein n=1 Tax=Pelomonas cellulosilytica TaxID=2906762 RepID=A0ABS8XSU8_9BURK|nr:hypothetical protein [Pelomonas sp. P8]MCE4553798.1 hypothetical protein [Pelomonas sp. P8]